MSESMTVVQQSVSMTVSPSNTGPVAVLASSGGAARVEQSGPQGPRGLPGIDGDDGADGIDGEDGADGIDGADSTVAGPAGPAGAGVLAAVTYSVNSQNMNTDTAPVLLTADDTLGTGFTFASNQITCNFDGWVRISYGIELQSTSQRPAPRVRVQKNTVNVPGTIAVHTYIRAASGHNESSANASMPFAVADGDVLRLASSQISAAGTVTATSGAFAVERIA